jgi:anti-sigma factor RsiW
VRCEEARQESAAFVLGDLNGTDRAEFVGHLSGCATCQAEVAELTMTLDRLGHAVSPVPVSAGFVERVMAGLEQHQPVDARHHHPAQPPAAGRRLRSTPRLGGWRPGGWTRRRRAVLAAATLVTLGAVIAGGSVVGGLVGPDHPSGHLRSPGATHVAQAPAAVADLRTDAGAAIGQVVIFDHPRPWVSVSLAVPAGSTSAPLGPYVVVVDSRAGQRMPLGQITLLDGRGALGATPGVAVSDIADIRVQTPGGGDLCSGFLARSGRPPPPPGLPGPSGRGGVAAPPGR